MNVQIICGSRNHDGQTAHAVAALVEGLKAGGAETDLAFLPELRIERCRQCDPNGWGLCRKEARCVIEDDDFARLLARIRAADAVVFATPVYYGDLSESMRAFTDRLRRVCGPEAGKAGITGKPAIGVCVAGGGGGGAVQCCVSLEKVVGICGFDIRDMVPVRRQNLAMKCDVLRTVGRWLTAR